MHSHIPAREAFSQWTDGLDERGLAALRDWAMAYAPLRGASSGLSHPSSSIPSAIRPPALLSGLAPLVRKLGVQSSRPSGS
jgi:hypothetical protein